MVERQARVKPFWAEEIDEVAQAPSSVHPLWAPGASQACCVMRKSAILRKSGMLLDKVTLGP